MREYLQKVYTSMLGNRDLQALGEGVPQLLVQQAQSVVLMHRFVKEICLYLLIFLYIHSNWNLSKFIIYNCYLLFPILLRWLCTKFLRRLKIQYLVLLSYLTTQCYCPSSIGWCCSLWSLYNGLPGYWWICHLSIPYIPSPSVPPDLILFPLTRSVCFSAT